MNTPEEAADSAFSEGDDAFTPADNNADAKIASLEAMLVEANSRVLKVQAEMENFRKRVRREQEEESRYAALPLARDLLSVVDNLERAIQSAEKTGDQKGLLDGVKMVAIQFTAILEQHGCKRIAALGAEFDPNLHQAIAQENSEEYASGTVSKVAQSGYTLNDRVIRPAQVFVSLGKA